MIVVIQCAATKKPEAGYLQRRDGQKVMFVAGPENAPVDQYSYAHPDDTADTGNSWRDELLKYNDKYNADLGNNPLGLLPAWQLYENKTYGMLAKRYGKQRLYILSAGWGLIASDFLTAAYDITFSGSADEFKRRQKKDCYNDLRMLSADNEVPVVFFVSQAYVSLACKLTESINSPKYLFYNSKKALVAPGCHLIKYDTRTRTNWHYQCAKDFIEGKIGI